MKRKWPAMAGAKINLSLHVLSSCFHKTGSKLCITQYCSLSSCKHGQECVQLQLSVGIASVIFNRDQPTKALFSRKHKRVSGTCSAEKLIRGKQ